MTTRRILQFQFLRAGHHSQCTIGSFTNWRLEDRIWIDGCFDFAHHGISPALLTPPPPLFLVHLILTPIGHANAILQAKHIGSYLVVGVHSDEAIFENKGPTVMTLPERILAVQACKWTNLAVPNAPYVTQPEWLDLYGCQYVVHGDDITTDSEGNDCYQVVKDMGRFKVVKRTRGISTTDLVGRMLLCTRGHHLPTDHKWTTEELDHIKAFASDERGIQGVGSQVWNWVGEGKPCQLIVDGKGPEGRKTVYVDGGFDLFSSGHIEFLRQVVETEIKEAAARGEYEGDDKEKGGRKPFVIAGVHDDKTINHFKGLNYPIMNLFERSLLVLQCRVSFPASPLPLIFP